MRWNTVRIRTVQKTDALRPTWTSIRGGVSDHREDPLGEPIVGPRRANGGADVEGRVAHFGRKRTQRLDHQQAAGARGRRTLLPAVRNRLNVAQRLRGMIQALRLLEERRQSPDDT
jgi:hypothetical protein